MLLSKVAKTSLILSLSSNNLICKNNTKFIQQKIQKEQKNGKKKRKNKKMNSNLHQNSHCKVSFFHFCKQKMTKT